MFPYQRRLATKKKDNHLELHALDLATHNSTAFTLKEVVHEVLHNIFRQGGQRLRTDRFFTWPAEVCVAEGAELGLRHSARGTGLGGKEPIYCGSQGADGDNSTDVLMEVRPGFDHGNAGAKPLEK